MRWWHDFYSKTLTSEATGHPPVRICQTIRCQVLRKEKAAKSTSKHVQLSQPIAIGGQRKNKVRQANRATYQANLTDVAFEARKARLERAAKACGERHEAAIGVVDVLEGGLHGYRCVERASPGELRRPLVALLVTGVLAREATGVDAVGIGGAELGVTVTSVLAAGVLGVLGHGREALPSSLP